MTEGIDDFPHPTVSLSQIHAWSTSFYFVLLRCFCKLGVDQRVREKKKTVEKENQLVYDDQSRVKYGFFC
jgi:hypothetical protein